MSLNTIKKLQSERGFTLVELLIVIVIIAILAAITIVAYNGLTNRAHASAAQQAAQNVVNKAEAYNAETGGYPATMSALTGATSDKSYYIPSTAISGAAGAAAPAALTGTAPNQVLAAPGSTDKDNRVGLEVCTVSGNVVGNKVHYWDYSKGQDATMTAGSTTTGCAGVSS